jgi:hypothetical protein
VGGPRGREAGPWGGDFAAPDGAVGAIGGVDSAIEGALRGAPICGEIGTLVTVLSKPGASVA